MGHTKGSLAASHKKKENQPEDGYKAIENSPVNALAECQVAALDSIH